MEAIYVAHIKLRKLYEHINFTWIYFLAHFLSSISTKIVRKSLFAPSNIYDNAGSYYSCEIKRQRRQVLSWSTKTPCKTTRLQQSNGSSFNHIFTRLWYFYISAIVFHVTKPSGNRVRLISKRNRSLFSSLDFFLFRCQCLIVNVIKRVGDSFPKLINSKVI